MNPLVPKPQYIIGTFEEATHNVSTDLALTQPLGFEYGERWQVSPNGDWQYPQVFLELPIIGKPESQNTDRYNLTFLLLQNLPSDEAKETYTLLYGETYTQMMAFVHELRHLFQEGDQSELTLLDFITIHDDFDDNCSGWRVEVSLLMPTDRLQC